MNWNIFWGLYTLAFAVRYNDISLPVVEYTANGRTYTVVGPKFSATVTKSFSSPFHRAKTDITSNLTTREDLPSVLKLNLRQNSLAGLTESPLLELYPIGSEVDVFYNLSLIHIYGFSGHVVDELGHHERQSTFKQHLDSHKHRRLNGRPLVVPDALH